MSRKELINTMPFPIYMRREWFKADIESVCAKIERLLGENDIEYLIQAEAAESGE